MIHEQATDEPRPERARRSPARRLGRLSGMIKVRLKGAYRSDIPCLLLNVAERLLCVAFAIMLCEPQAVPNGGSRVLTRWAIVTQCYCSAITRAA